MSIEEKSNEGQFSRSLNPMSSSDGVVAAGMLSGVKVRACVPERDRDERVTSAPYQISPR
jgi:hypothetical protein